MAGLGPRVLQVLEFAHARAPELQALHELSQHEETTNSTDGKLESQKNQRRRRANAFKAHKIPQRLRFTPKSGFQGSARCRKHERRSHKLLQERTLIDGSETERARWLASHIWHAKRMVMNERFGYVLAARRADKSVSAALQAVRSKAMLHDTSYYGVIELFGLPQVILEALQLVSDPNGSDFHGMRFLAGNEEGRSMLYHEGQFPQGAIAPVTFMWRPLGRDYDDGFKLHEDWQSTKRQLWIWVHPAAYMEAATAIAAACQEVVAEDEEGIEMHDRRGQLCRLKLRGRLADVLMKAVASEGGDDGFEWADVAEEEASDHEDGFDETQTMAKCRSDNRQNLLRALRATGKKTETGEQKDDIYCVDVKDPRLAWWKEGTLCHRSVRPEASFSLLNEPPAHAVPEVGTSVIASPLSGLSLSSRGKDAEEPEPKVILKEMQALLAWTTSSSIGTSSEDGGGSSYPSVIAGGDLAQLDAEVDDSAMEVESSPSSLLWSLSKRRKIEMNFVKDHELNEAVYRQRKEGGNSGGTRVKSQPLAIMAIKKHEPFPRTSGWDLVCSPCSVPGLLKALVFGGALVVGLEEDAALSAVLHQASFPCDFPDTQAGQAYWGDRAQGLETQEAKKPKSKRFNYDKHGVKSPFQPRWESLFDALSTQDSAAEEDQTAPCVLRGEKYMEPFSFHPSSHEATPSPAPGAEAIVPVPMPTLVRVAVAFPRRGIVDVNAMIFAPSAEDHDRFRRDKSWQGCHAGLSKKSEAQNATADERPLVGYVTSAVYDRPKGAFRATGFVACEPLQELFRASQGRDYGKQGHHALAMIRSPRGRMVRPVLVHAEI